LTNARIRQVLDYENGEFSEREKLALRYADLLKYNPQGTTPEFLAELKRHFTDAQICEIGYVMLAYGGAHQFLSSIKERVLDDAGRDISETDGFPIVFHTMEARSEWQSAEASGVDAPLPERPRGR
jgi:hypothetical protein